MIGMAGIRNQRRVLEYATTAATANADLAVGRCRQQRRPVRATAAAAAAAG